MNAPLTASQVAAMDETMTYTHPFVTTNPTSQAEQRRSFAMLEHALAQQRRHTDARTKAEAILAAFRQPADQALNHPQLTAILERVLMMFEDATDSHPDCDYKPVTDALELATIKLADVHSTWADAR